MKKLFLLVTAFIIAGLAATSAFSLAVCITAWICADTPSNSYSFNNRRSEHRFLVHPETLYLRDNREHHFRIWAVWHRGYFSPEVIVDTRFSSEKHGAIMASITYAQSLPTAYLNDYTFTHSIFENGQRKTFSERDVVFSFHPLTLSIMFGIVPVFAVLIYIYFRLVPHHWQLITCWLRSAATRLNGHPKSRGFDVIVQKDGK